MTDPRQLGTSLDRRLILLAKGSRSESFNRLDLALFGKRAFLSLAQPRYRNSPILIEKRVPHGIGNTKVPNSLDDSPIFACQSINWSNGNHERKISSQIKNKHPDGRLKARFEEDVFHSCFPFYQFRMLNLGATVHQHFHALSCSAGVFPQTVR